MDLLIVLEDDNISRIKEHDSAEVKWSQLGAFCTMKPRIIGISYASAEEVARLHELIGADDVVGALKLLTGGFKFRPELGDHDFGPISLKGSKQ